MKQTAFAGKLRTKQGPKPLQNPRIPSAAYICEAAPSLQSAQEPCTLSAQVQNLNERGTRQWLTTARHGLLLTHTATDLLLHCYSPTRVFPTQQAPLHNTTHSYLPFAPQAFMGMCLVTTAQQAETIRRRTRGGKRHTKLKR